MPARGKEAERLRECRVLFERASAMGCTPAEVRQRDAQARWAATEAKLAARRCGTEIKFEEAGDQDEGRQLAWWHR